MTRVREVMNADPMLVQVPGTRRDLLPILAHSEPTAHPVVKDATRKLVGVIGAHDVIANPDEEQVSILMNPNPTTTYAEATAEEAGRLIAERELRVLPVVNSANDVVGTLGPLDVLRALRPPSGHVASHLRRRAVPVHHVTPAAVALEILRLTRSPALPLLDDEARYAGFVSERSFLGHMALGETVHRTTSGGPEEGDSWKWERVRGGRAVQRTGTRLELPRVPASDLAGKEPPAIQPHTPTREAIRFMLQAKTEQLVVIDSERRVVDLLTAVDLLPRGL